MGKASTDEMWVICPHCLVRGIVPRSATGAQVKCRQCATVFVAEPEKASREELMEEELQLAPLDLPPASGVQSVWESPEPEYGMAEETIAHPMVGKTPPIPPAPPEKQPDYVVVPPKNAGLFWAFASNTFLFPWHLSALLQWIYASAGLMVAGSVLLLIVVMGLNLFAPMVVVGAAVLMLVAISYSAASLFDITVNAAYNCDKSQDWPQGAWSERIVHLVRAIYLIAIAAMPAALVAEGFSMVADVFWPTLAITVFLIFPILMLASLEADSYFWPISMPMFRSLIAEWKGWLVFYILAGLLLLGTSYATQIIADRTGMWASVALGPLWAAVVFIYARLLGRLTWLILRHTELIEDKKIKQKEMADPLLRTLP